MQLIGFFALLCVFLSCLGLYGLTSFTIEQRTKEIGIRKVLGSSSWEIIFLLFKNILMVIVFAIVLASGLSYLIMDKWLEGFFYHTEINPLVFLISGLVSISIAFVTVAIQSYKTAKADPSHAFRYE